MDYVSVDDALDVLILLSNNTAIIIFSKVMIRKGIMIPAFSATPLNPIVIDIVLTANPIVRNFMMDTVTCPCYIY
jgi:hypothetical protein